jgi:hypothetical protein
MGRSVIDADESATILGEHLNVGEDKSVSCLPIRALETVIGMPVDQYVRIAESKGLRAIIFLPEETCINSGAVYVYSEAALLKILESSSAILSEIGLPKNPSEFVRKIAKEWFDSNNAIMPIVRRAFGNK